MCTVLLPPGGNPIAVKYISYQLQSQLTGFYELCRALDLFPENLSQNKICYVHRAHQEWGKLVSAIGALHLRAKYQRRKLPYMNNDI